MKNSLLTVLAAVLVLQANILLGDETKIDTNSKVTKVTVYSDRALITREAGVDLSAGVNIVSFTKIPANIDNNSIRVSSADKGLKILGIETSDLNSEKPVNEKLADLDDKLIALSDERKAKDDASQTLNNKESFLNSIKAKGADNFSKEIVGAKTAGVKDWKEMAQFLEDSYNDISKSRRELQVEIRKLDKKMDLLQQERNKISYDQGTRYKTVLVSVEGSKKDKANLGISYIIYNANWRPLYDARVVSDKKKVDLTYFGVITQRTGEDWNDVELSLSTARPSVAGRLPEITPKYLSLYVPPPPQIRREFMAKSMAMPAGAATKMQDAAAQGYDKQEEAETGELRKNIDVVTYETSDMSESATAVFFKIKKKEDVPSDGNPHKVIVSVENFPAEFEYETVPELSAMVILKTKLTNGEKPLLAGSMNIFLDQDFVGSSYIKTVSPSEKFDAYLGTDEGIKVERKDEKKQEGSSGWFFSGNNKKYTRAYRIIVTNYKKETVKLTITDRIPVSQNEELKINVVKIDPEIAKTKEGYLKWNIELKPSEKKEFYFEYTVEHPKDKTLSGDSSAQFLNTR